LKEKFIAKIYESFFLNEKDEFIIAIRQKFSYPKRQIKIKEQNKNWKKK
jgi:hypothetical protein